MQKSKIIVTKPYKLFPAILSQTKIITTTKKELLSKGVKQIIEEKTGWTQGYEFATVTHIDYKKEQTADQPIDKN